MSTLYATLIEQEDDKVIVKPARIMKLIRLIEEEPYYNKHMALIGNSNNWKELRAILGFPVSQ